MDSGDTGPGQHPRQQPDMCERGEVRGERAFLTRTAVEVITHLLRQPRPRRRREVRHGERLASGGGIETRTHTRTRM
jgi:hypothetical protein